MDKIFIYFCKFSEKILRNILEILQKKLWKLWKVCFHSFIFIREININWKTISLHPKGGVSISTPSAPTSRAWGHVPPATMNGTRLVWVVMIRNENFEKLEGLESLKTWCTCIGVQITDWYYGSGCYRYYIHTEP